MLSVPFAANGGENSTLTRLMFQIFLLSQRLEEKKFSVMPIMMRYILFRMPFRDSSACPVPLTNLLVTVDVGLNTTILCLLLLVTNGVLGSGVGSSRFHRAFLFAGSFRRWPRLGAQAAVAALPPLVLVATVPLDGPPTLAV